MNPTESGAYPELMTSEARVVWAAIREMDEADQHLVLGALRQRLALVDERDSPHRVRMARGIAALREAAAQLGRSPSVAAYRQLREEHPERRWPPDGSLRRWLSPSKSWNEALREARLDAVPEHLTHAPSRPEYTHEEVLDAVRAAAAELDTPLEKLTFTSYMNWVRSPEVRRRPGKRPASQNVFERRWGSWKGTLLAAIGGSEGDAERRLAMGGVVARGYRYSDEELFQAIDEIVERRRTGRSAAPRGQGDINTLPSLGIYLQVRQEMLDEALAPDEPPRAVPSSNILCLRFGNWARARQRFEEWRSTRSGEESS